MKKKFGRSRIINEIFHGLFRVGLFSALQRSDPNRLTVLNYHRVADSSGADFYTFKPNVSASPGAFALQMDYVKKNYNVISVDHLASWLRGEKALPAHAAIITFDDGYFDNLKYAHPILRQRGLPAVIFLATDYMGSNFPFYWDYAAYCIYHTGKDRVQLPSGTCVLWDEDSSRDRVINRWVQSVKYLSRDEKLRALDDLSMDLDVVVPSNAFAGLYLTWDQVRELVNDGVEFGAHTASHPILTRVSLSQVESELSTSKRKVREETGKPALSFAYPNGGVSDFSPEIIQLVKKIGFNLAFTLMPGPSSYGAVKRDPFAIRRIYVGQSSTLPRFAAKLAGIEKVAEFFQPASGGAHY